MVCQPDRDRTIPPDGPSGLFGEVQEGGDRIIPPTTMDQADSGVAMEEGSFTQLWGYCRSDPVQEHEPATTDNRETEILPRASPEAELEASVASGPLEIAEPAVTLFSSPPFMLDISPPILSAAQLVAQLSSVPSSASTALPPHPLPAAAVSPSSPPGEELTEREEPAPQPVELSEREEPAPQPVELSEREPELELSEQEPELSVPPAEEFNEPEGPALPAEDLGKREEPVLPAEDLGEPEGPAQPKPERALHAIHVQCVHVSDQRVIGHVPHLAVAQRSSAVAIGPGAGRRRSSAAAATGPVAGHQNRFAAAAGPVAARRSCCVSIKGGLTKPRAPGPAKQPLGVSQVKPSRDDVPRDSPDALSPSLPPHQPQ
ncbi:fibrous sheath CABYR-binding protein-like [Astatotilapia calliptera]|uniref:fibrous sheath CABYR-binding protein-like n=1 Tax=Astatotilapia calliptera TaxID=8154 RepID=UPI000E401875|nr:fibrous sheath CABYR-binding protein-like [Astatotilapia calliptera]